MIIFNNWKVTKLFFYYQQFYSGYDHTHTTRSIKSFKNALYQRSSGLEAFSEPRLPCHIAASFLPSNKRQTRVQGRGKSLLLQHFNLMLRNKHGMLIVVCVCAEFSF